MIQWRIRDVGSEERDQLELFMTGSLRQLVPDAYAKVFAAFESRGIDALIPAKAEPIRRPVPLRRFRYDAKHDILKCLRGKVLHPNRPLKYGRFFYSRARDCAGCDLASICLSKGRANKAVVVGNDYPAMLRARRRRERWSEEDKQPLSTPSVALGRLPWRSEELAWPSPGGSGA